MIYKYKVKLWVGNELNTWFQSENSRDGVLCIFSVTFPLFQAPVGYSNPAGQLLIIV